MYIVHIIDKQYTMERVISINSKHIKSVKDLIMSNVVYMKCVVMHSI